MSLTETEFKIINTVRRLNNTAGRNELEFYSKVSNQTIFNALKDKDGAVSSRTLIGSDKSISLKEDFCYYIGISVGTSHIKFIILNYIFEPVFKNEWSSRLSLLFDDKNEYDMIAENSGLCFVTPKEDVSIFMEIINTTLDFFIDEINVKGIGLALPGVIDYKNNIVLNCSNIKYLTGLKESDLIYPKLYNKINEKNITFAFEHNSKASVVAEKEKSHNCLTDEKNVACLYLGTGIGAGFIFDNKLYRGQDNSSGQIGHMKIFFENEVSDICTCGQKNCLEQLTRNLFYDKDKNYNFDNELDEKKIETLSRYVSFVISNLLNCLSLDTIIITGRFSNYFDKMWKYLNKYYTDFCFGNLKSLCTVRTSTLKLFAPAYGAAICSYFKENNATIEW